MLELVKSNETEKSEQNYIYSAKDIWELSNSSSRTWDNFVADFLIAIDCDQKRDYLEEHASRSGGNKYTEKTLKAFQAWLMKNQANQEKSSEVVKQATTQAVEKEQGNWYSLEELSQITGYGKNKLNHLLTEVSFVQMSKAHSKLGGYHNSQKFYDEYILKAIKAYQLKAHGNMINAEQANQTTANILSKAEQMMDLQTIAESGNVDAMKQFMNRMVAYTQIQAENKRLLEQTKQMEHALNYTAVIGWKKWSDLKKELAQSFEIFQHRISFKTVAAEAGLVKETDYAERIY